MQVKGHKGQGHMFKNFSTNQMASSKGTRMKNMTALSHKASPPPPTQEKLTLTTLIKAVVSVPITPFTT